MTYQECVNNIELLKGDLIMTAFIYSICLFQQFDTDAIFLH